VDDRVYRADHRQNVYRPESVISSHQWTVSVHLDSTAITGPPRRSAVTLTVDGIELAGSAVGVRPARQGSVPPGRVDSAPIPSVRPVCLVYRTLTWPVTSNLVCDVLSAVSTLSFNATVLSDMTLSATAAVKVTYTSLYTLTFPYITKKSRLPGFSRQNLEGEDWWWWW